jgi:DNA polymerase-4
MAGDRQILHIDMDAFYASVEQLDDPAIRGKPVVVGARSARGVVTAASYEARPFGVHSAMPMVLALRRCPQAIVVAPRMDRYVEVSCAVFGILKRFTPLVEGCRSRGADVTGEPIALWGRQDDRGKIKETIFEETGSGRRRASPRSSLRRSRATSKSRMAWCGAPADARISGALPIEGCGGSA